VTNGLDAPILLMTPLPRFEGQVIKGAAARLYAFVDTDGILQLTKRLWLAPEEIGVFFFEVPFATEVGPGWAFEERIAIELPIAIDYPYRPVLEGEAKSEELGEAEQVAFSIGYVVEEKEPLRRGPASAESGASLAIGYGTAAQHQRIAQGGVMALAVAVKDVG